MSLSQLILQAQQQQAAPGVSPSPTTTQTPTAPPQYSWSDYLTGRAKAPTTTPAYTYGEGAALKDSFKDPTYNYTGSTLNEQIRNAMDWQNSSGGAWAGLGADRMFGEMEQALSSRGITNLNQVGMQNQYDYRPIMNELDDQGLSTGRRFISWANDENSPEQRYFLTQGDIGNIVQRDNGEGGTYDALQALTGQKLYGGNNVGGWSTPGNVFGHSYAGDGGTHFMFDPQADGTVKLRTRGTSSADFDKQDLMGVASVLGIAAGGAALAGSGTGAEAAGGMGGFAGDATAAGYGGLDAASAASMGGGYSVAGGAPLTGLGSVGVSAGGAGISDALSKAALDGTTAFGANSAPGALDISALSSAAPGAESANALGQITSNLGYSGGLGLENIPTSNPLSSSGSTTSAPTGTPSSTGTIPSTSGVGSMIQNILGGGGGSGASGAGSGGINLSGIAGLLSGVYGYNQQNNASNEMLNYLKQRQSINDNMYAPGSAEYNALWDEMSRKDAAAGRNSQYGPRSVDLAARVAQLKMDANTKMTTGIGNLMAASLNNKANAGANITSMIPGLLGAGGVQNLSSAGGVQNLSSLVGGLDGLFGGSGSTVTADDWNNLGDGLGEADYSNLFNDMDFGSLFG